MAQRARTWLAALWLAVSLAYACGGTESNPKPGATGGTEVAGAAGTAGAGADAGAGTPGPAGGVPTGGAGPSVGRWDESPWDDSSIVWGD